jgi:hypothetical protein
VCSFPFLSKNINRFFPDVVGFPSTQPIVLIGFFFFLKEYGSSQSTTFNLYFLTHFSQADVLYFIGPSSLH